MAAKSILQDQQLIREVMDACTHDIITDVQYEYIKGRILPLFSPLTLQRAEGKNRANPEIMANICSSVKTLSHQNFLKFVQALDVDYGHVAEILRSEYKKVSGQELSKGGLE